MHAAIGAARIPDALARSDAARLGTACRPAFGVPRRFKSMSGSFLYAVRFLTRIPIPFRGQLSAAAIGGSLIYYPVVGALIGIMLAALAALLHDRLVPALLAALRVV